MVVFATWPFAIVAFVYAFSFFFKNASQAQIFFVVSQLFVMLCLSQITFNLRMVEKFELYADCAMWFFRILPSFPIVNSLYVEASAKALVKLRLYTS